MIQVFQWGRNALGGLKLDSPGLCAALPPFLEKGPFFIFLQASSSVYRERDRDRERGEDRERWKALCCKSRLQVVVTAVLKAQHEGRVWLAL